MANRQTECLNERCDNKIEGCDKWCSMICKRRFLLDNYSDGQCSHWFEQFNKEFKKKQRRVMEEIKESGLSFSEFFASLGEFKEDKSSPVEVQER